MPHIQFCKTKEHIRKLRTLKLTLTYSLALVCLYGSCKKDDALMPISSSVFSVCDNLIAQSCSGNGFGDYCTFGYKWGQGNPFSNAGLNKPGPSIGTIEISFKFQDAGSLFNTHSQSRVSSFSFDAVSCSKQQIRDAISQWEAVIDVKFIEKASTEISDIKIILANIEQGGIGYPNYPDVPCNELAGLLFINVNQKLTCDNFLTLSLHEIGHVLGLGHVTSSNVMNPKLTFSKLQDGDVKGAQSIYGKK
jgi:hypothetical protein